MPERALAIGIRYRMWEPGTPGKRSCKQPPELSLRASAAAALPVPQPLCRCVSCPPPRVHLAPASLSPSLLPCATIIPHLLAHGWHGAVTTCRPAGPRLSLWSGCLCRAGGHAGCAAVGAVGFFQLPLWAENTSGHAVLLWLLRPCPQCTLVFLLLPS